MTVAAPNDMRDLKVRIPLQYYLQLHTIKLLKGKNMSDALTEALDMYFAIPEHAAVPRLALDEMNG